MPRILFATSRDQAELTDDDELAAGELRDRGFEVRPAVWTDEPLHEFAAADAVVIRSCWDYHLRVDEFGEWLTRLQRAGARVVNPPPLIEWNLHKAYLLELERSGVPIVPTELVASGASREAGEILERRGWARAVVKPAVSASAHETWILSTPVTAEPAERFGALLARTDLLVQPFLPEVTSDGEWSLLFFGGEFSHAVRKRPAPGDFRVQFQLGGVHVAEHPPAGLLRDAERAVGALPHHAAYARVDGVASETGLLVMEVECIEPFLFLGDAPHAPARFADAIVGRGR